MSKRHGILMRVRAKVRALLPEHWRGAAGERFRQTAATISEYSQEHVRVRERMEEAPDVIWDSLKERSSRTLVNAAEEEGKRIASELARQTLTDKTRQERATAERLEAEARISKITEIQARLTFVERLQGVGVVPVWDIQGNMMFIKAPDSYDWDGLKNRLLIGTDVSVPPNASSSRLRI